MGFDLDRFEAPVNEGLLCSICRGVLEDPLQAPCEHTFCRKCIETWLLQENTCPEDRKILLTTELRPLFRYMKNDLDRLVIWCRYRAEGCQHSCPLESVAGHEESCSFGEAERRLKSGLGLVEEAAWMEEVREEFEKKLVEQKVEMERQMDLQRRQLVQKETNLQRQIDELRAIMVRIQQDVRRMSEKERSFDQQVEQLQREKRDLVDLLKEFKSNKSNVIVSKVL